MSTQNILIPVDTIAEAVVSCIWSNLQASLGLKICEQALEDSPVEIGETPEEVEARLPAVYVIARGWDEGEGLGPQTSLGNTNLRIRLTSLVQLPMTMAPADMARSAWQRGQALGELFSRPDFAFPGSISLPSGVQFRRVRPTSIESFTTADLVDIGVRVAQSDVELLLQFASFGKR